MQTNDETVAVTVLGDQREHPAVRRLARACIALARWHRETATDDPADEDDAAQGRLLPEHRA